MFIPRENEDNAYVIFFMGGGGGEKNMVYYGYFLTYLNGGWRKGFRSLVFGFVELIW